MPDLSRIELQARVDGAHLCLLLAAAESAGLVKSIDMDIDVEACREVIAEAELKEIRPRADLVELPKLLTEMHDLRNPKLAARSKDALTATVNLHKRERTEMREFVPLWSMLRESARQNIPDIALTQDGLAVRMEGSWYLLPPAELFSVVADAYGLPIDKPDSDFGKLASQKSPFKEAVVSGKAWKAAFSTEDEYPGPRRGVAVALNEKDCTLTCERREGVRSTFVSAPIEGRFPKFRDVIPTSPALLNIRLDPRRLITCLEAILKLGACDEDGSVVIEFRDGAGDRPVVIRAENEDQKTTVLLMPIKREP